MFGGDRDGFAQAELERLVEAGLGGAALALVGDQQGRGTGAAHPIGEMPV